MVMDSGNMSNVITLILVMFAMWLIVYSSRKKLK